PRLLREKKRTRDVPEVGSSQGAGAHDAGHFVTKRPVWKYPAKAGECRLQLRGKNALAGKDTTEFGLQQVRGIDRVERFDQPGRGLASRLLEHPGQDRRGVNIRLLQ